MIFIKEINTLYRPLKKYHKLLYVQIKNIAPSIYPIN